MKTGTKILVALGVVGAGAFAFWYFTKKKNKGGAAILPETIGTENAPIIGGGGSTPPPAVRKEYAIDQSHPKSGYLLAIHPSPRPAYGTISAGQLIALDGVPPILSGVKKVERTWKDGSGKIGAIFIKVEPLPSQIHQVSGLFTTLASNPRALNAGKIRIL